MTDLERATEQIAFARGYTLGLLEDVAPDEWFRIPAAGVTHVGWQVGHLAFAQYRLVLLRMRGKQPGDEELIPEEFVRLYSADTTPEPDPAKNLPVATVRAVLDRVHVAVMLELSRLDPARLQEPIDPPHPIAKTKAAALFWCAAHEMVHAGQIGLLRRQLGHAPRW